MTSGVTSNRDETIPFDNIRRRTAEHMVRSKATSAHVYTSIEVDYERVERVRKAHQAEWKAVEGFSLTYLPFIARAFSDTVRDFPQVNASVGDDALIVHHDVHLAIAVDLDFQGLVAPVIRNVDGKRLRLIAREIHDLADRARTKKLTPDDVLGGTFTITNPGPFGTYATLPIINQPQVAILVDRRHQEASGRRDRTRRRRHHRHPPHGVARPDVGPPRLRRCVRRRVPAGACARCWSSTTGKTSSTDAPDALARSGALRGSRPVAARAAPARRPTTTSCCSSTRTCTRSARRPILPTCSCRPPRSVPSSSGPTVAAT